MQEIKIKTPIIHLDQFLKWANIVSSGGEAKLLIQSGQVFVNGAVETKRSVKLVPGDQITLSDGREFVIGCER